MKKNYFLRSLFILPFLLLGFIIVFQPANSQNTPTGLVKSNPTIKLFPNPAKETLTVTIENNIHSRVDLVIYNSLGSEISRKIESTEDNNDIKLSMPNLKAGLYLLKITVDNQTFTRSFYKE